MHRRLMCIMMVIGLLGNLAVQGAAAAQTGAICVVLDCGEGVVSSGTVTLYRVGEPVAGGYRLQPEFGGAFVAEEDAGDSALAQRLVGLADSDGVAHYPDADGRVAFSWLAEGLYLIVQTEAADGYYPVVPFLVQLPCEGQWYVEANPKMLELPEEQPQTGQHPAPILAAMGLVLSGVGLVVLADKRNRRR